MDLSQFKLTIVTEYIAIEFPNTSENSEIMLFLFLEVHGPILRQLRGLSSFAQLKTL